MVIHEGPKCCVMSVRRDTCFPTFPQGLLAQGKCSYHLLNVGLSEKLVLLACLVGCVDEVQKQQVVVEQPLVFPFLYCSLRNAWISCLRSRINQRVAVEYVQPGPGPRHCLLPSDVAGDLLAHTSSKMQDDPCMSRQTIPSLHSCRSS